MKRNSWFSTTDTSVLNTIKVTVHTMYLPRLLTFYNCNSMDSNRIHILSEFENDIYI